MHAVLCNTQEFFNQFSSSSQVSLLKLVAHRLLSALPQLVLSFVQLFLYFLELFITIPCYLKSKDVSLLLQ